MSPSHSTISRSAADVKAQLEGLYAEQVLARLEGLAEDAAYMADLHDEINATSAAYVGAAVTEIASLRAALDGRLEG